MQVVKGIAALLAVPGVFIFYLFLGWGSETLAISKLASVLSLVYIALIIIAIWMLLYWKGKRRIVLISVLAVSVLFCGSIFAIDYDRKFVQRLAEGDLLLGYEPIENSKIVKFTTGLQMSSREFPKLDGSTALYPVYSSLAYNVLTDKSKVLSRVFRTGTDKAYTELIVGSVDIIFVPAPSKGQIERALEAGVSYEITPIGREAFVFIVNSKNKVDGLTGKQIRQIYSGNIMNWREIGGRNSEIRAYQRNENSGSQTAFMNFMGNTKIMEPIEEAYAVPDMIGLARAVAISDYKNYHNAIGYSFRFYTSEMVRDNNIKMLAIDGVQPTRENINNKTYPIADNFYAVTILERPNDNVGKLIQWLISEEGQDFINETGYVGSY